MKFRTINIVEGQLLPDREKVSRYLESLATAKITFIPLSHLEEDFIGKVMNLPFQDAAEKRMFCHDLSLLTRDLRFPVVWNEHHLVLLLQLHRRRQPADDLACLAIPLALARQSGLGIYPLLVELIDSFHSVPTTALQWLEILHLCWKEIDPACLSRLVNGSAFSTFTPGQLQQLRHLDTSQLNGVSLFFATDEAYPSNLQDLVFYFLAKMDLPEYSLPLLAEKLRQFIEEVLPQAEVRMNDAGFSFVASRKTYPKALGLFHLWLFHQEQPLPFDEKTFGPASPEGTLADFRRLAFANVVRYLPVRWLWDIPLLLTHNRRLLIHLAAGKNIRTFPGLQLPVSKKTAHVFHNLPPGTDLSRKDINESIQDAYWKGLGLRGRLWYMIYYFGGFIWVLDDVTARLARYRQDQRPHFENWEKVIKRLVHLSQKEPNLLELSHPELEQIFRYFQYLIIRGSPLNLAGCTLTSIRRRAGAWQPAVPWITAGQDQSPEEWPGAPYQEYRAAVDGTGYRIMQLTTAADLIEESKTLSHCVRSYRSKCAAGISSIWSLRSEEEAASRPLVTIEVERYGRIVQVKGKNNRAPKPFYRSLIEDWATQEGLSFAHRQ